MNTWVMIFLLGCAGALGTILRFGISHFLSYFFGTHYPWGTTVVNLLGCFGFGVLAAFFLAEKLPSQWRIVLLTGFLGGFTTYSAYAFEIQQFLQHGKYTFAIIHFGIQNFIGVAAAATGMYLGRYLIFS